MDDNKCIMVVDDDPDLLEQICDTMTRDGFEVVAAGGHDEASEMLLSVHPDLAIVDLMLERSDSGFSLCHELKSLDPRTPVIILTAVTAATGLDFGGGDARARAWTRADALLDKPIRPELLLYEVHRLLEGGVVGG
jgi:DNA-binding response OmpR family regulator